MDLLTNCREWIGGRMIGSGPTTRRTLAVYELEGMGGVLTLGVDAGGALCCIDLTPRQALELSEHLLSFAVRCAQ